MATIFTTMFSSLRFQATSATEPWRKVDLDPLFMKVQHCSTLKCCWNRSKSSVHSDFMQLRGQNDIGPFCLFMWNCRIIHLPCYHTQSIYLTGLLMALRSTFLPCYHTRVIYLTRLLITLRSAFYLAITLGYLLNKVVKCLNTLLSHSK